MINVATWCKCWISYYRLVAIVWVKTGYFVWWIVQCESHIACLQYKYKYYCKFQHNTITQNITSGFLNYGKWFMKKQKARKCVKTGKSQVENNYFMLFFHSNSNSKLSANILTKLSYFTVHSVSSYLTHGVEKQQLVHVQEPSRAMIACQKLTYVKNFI